MISAWKRFINKNEATNEPASANGVSSVPPGVQKLDKELQKKFARGVNYNMKIIIKGDARVGKTSLFLRLKGCGFDETYVPTDNLNVTSINWNYKATDDIVKIDLWEAVDATARRYNSHPDLKTENLIRNSSSSNAEQFNEVENKQDTIRPTNGRVAMNGGTNNNPIPESAKQSLAELCSNLDVYKGADAVLLVLDMTKLWTFKYIQTELIKVPKHIPVLVIANHRDQGHHRTVSPEQVKAFIDGLDRGPCDGIIMYTEASMKNGFGLKLVEKFFNIPFLRLQESSLLKQLELNRSDYLTTLEELEIMQESGSREYEQYLEMQTILRRQQADAMSPVNSGLRQLDAVTREQIRNTAVSSTGTNKVTDIKSIESIYQDKQSDAQVFAEQKFVNDRLASIVIGAKCPLPETKSIQMNATKKFVQISNSPDNTAEISEESDEEEVPRANPLVADYQSDLDSDDQMAADAS